MMQHSKPIVALCALALSFVVGCWQDPVNPDNKPTCQGPNCKSFCEEFVCGAKPDLGLDSILTTDMDSQIEPDLLSDAISDLDLARDIPADIPTDIPIENLPQDMDGPNPDMDLATEFDSQPLVWSVEPSCDVTVHRTFERDPTGATSPASYELTVSNTGTEIFTWEAESNKPWLSFSTQDTYLEPKDQGTSQGTLTIHINAAANDLWMGTHWGQVTLSTDYQPNDPIVCSIELIIYNPGTHLWSKSLDNPVFSGTPGAWDKMVGAPSVIKDDTNYKMWYLGMDPGNMTIAIGYATSPDGTTWSSSVDSVLEPGAPGQWDNPYIAAQTVVYNESTAQYHLYYVAGEPASEGGSDSNLSMGLAFSSNGIDWDKQTVNDPLANLGPWQDQIELVDLSVVIEEANDWKMWWGEKEIVGTSSIEMATSTDGIVWNPNSTTAMQFESPYRINGVSVVKDPQTFRLFVGLDSTVPAILPKGIVAFTSQDGLTWDGVTNPWSFASNNRVLLPSGDGAFDRSRWSLSVLRESSSEMKMWYGGSADTGDYMNGKIGMAQTIGLGNVEVTVELDPSVTCGSADADDCKGAFQIAVGPCPSGACGGTVRHCENNVDFKTTPSFSTTIPHALAGEAYVWAGLFEQAEIGKGCQKAPVEGDLEAFPTTTISVEPYKLTPATAKLTRLGSTTGNPGILWGQVDHTKPGDCGPLASASDNCIGYLLVLAYDDYLTDDPIGWFFTEFADVTNSQQVYYEIRNMPLNETIYVRAILAETSTDPLQIPQLGDLYNNYYPPESTIISPSTATELPIGLSSRFPDTE